MDGGTVWNTNLVSVVLRCRDLVDDDSKITVDIILCSTTKLDDWKNPDSALGNYLRF